MSAPEISVVMAVYNGGFDLRPTLESIVGEKGVNLEFIVVNDGSTDGTRDVLHEFAARETRMRLIEQKNLGLTSALIRGCDAARGKFIARQDSGDISIQGRLYRQQTRLQAEDRLVAVCCHTKTIGPGGEDLFYSVQTEGNLNLCLRATDFRQLSGPSHHGSVMMKADAYRAVGGYRKQFYFAQDLDLWTRLVDIGRFGVISEVLYIAKFSPGSISGMFAPQQRQLTRIIAKAAIARRSSKDEMRYIKQATKIKYIVRQQSKSRIARGNYFVGNCLRLTSPELAKKYFKASFASAPFFWRTWLRLVECTIKNWMSRI